MVLIKQYTKIPIKTGRENVFIYNIGSPAGAFANVRFAIFIRFIDSDARRTEVFKNSLKKILKLIEYIKYFVPSGDLFDTEVHDSS